MTQNTMNIITYALTGAVAFGLIGGLGVFLTRSVIKNLKSSSDEPYEEEYEEEEKIVKKETVVREVSDMKKERVVKKENSPNDEVVNQKIETVVKRQEEEYTSQATLSVKEIALLKDLNNQLVECFRAQIKEGITIGRTRDKNDWSIVDDHTVSSKHCKIYVLDGEVYIMDLNSTNGTYINGTKITYPVVVKDKDKILIGSSEYSMYFIR